MDLFVVVVSFLLFGAGVSSSLEHKFNLWKACSKYFVDFITFSVKFRTGACGVYNVQECKRILPGWSGSGSNNVGSTAAALSPVDVILFRPGAGTAISEGALLVK